ncbi:hypothetical protein [Chryseobacterium rhizoplanae]|nr:hypothetical protein [Chryseobacterium rhizoplanae]
MDIVVSEKLNIGKILQAVVLNKNSIKKQSFKKTGRTANAGKYVK